MINGHGDDIYQYSGIRCNFSSNISPLIDNKQLRQYLAERLEVIRNYPEPSAHSLEVLLAARHGISADEVLVTSGATDAIYLIAQTLRDERLWGLAEARAGESAEMRTFAVSRPTFSEYADACRMFGYEEVVGEASMLYEDGSSHNCKAWKLHPLQADGCKAWKLHPLLCWLCNPNNPTGEVQTTDTVKELAHRHRWLVIDQSYEDYTLEPQLSAPEAIDMQNVIVIHSMTKRFAVPGLRLGYITAPREVIARLRSNYRPWAVNALAIEAGCWLMEHEMPYYREEMKMLLAQAQYLRERLRGVFGIHVYPTSTNFMLCSIQQSTAAELKAYLLEHHGFLIRDASNFEGLSASHFRIATQLPESNDKLVEAIRTFVYKVKRNA